MSIAITVFLLALVAVVGFVVLKNVTDDVIVSSKIETVLDKVCELGGQAGVIVATLAVFAEIVVQILSV